MQRKVDAGDLALAAGLAAIAGTLFYGARLIPPPFFDPVGSAAVPRGVAWALAGLLVVQIGLRLAGAQPRAPLHRGDLAMGRGAVFSMLILAGYCAVMQARWLDFAPATALFLAVSITVLVGSWRMLPLAAVIGLAMGYGCQWLFTDVFFVDLPRAR